MVVVVGKFVESLDAIFGELDMIIFKGVIVVGKNFDAVINCGWGLD